MSMCNCVCPQCFSMKISMSISMSMFWGVLYPHKSSESGSFSACHAFAAPAFAPPPMATRQAPGGGEGGDVDQRVVRDAAAGHHAGRRGGRHRACCCCVTPSHRTPILRTLDLGRVEAGPYLRQRRACRRQRQRLQVAGALADYSAYVSIQQRTPRQQPARPALQPLAWRALIVGGNPGSTAMAAPSIVKTVVVGDGAVGKTCMLVSYSEDRFPEEYVPTVFDNCTPPPTLRRLTVFPASLPLALPLSRTRARQRPRHVMNAVWLTFAPRPRPAADNCLLDIDGNPVSLELWDTAGQEDYDRVRPLSYPNTDVFLVCFSVNSRSSFNNVRDKWLVELHAQLMIDFTKTKVLLIGTKSDLRDDTGASGSTEAADLVGADEAEFLAEQIGADRYLECSARTRVGLKAVFDAALKLHLGLGEGEHTPHLPPRLDSPGMYMTRIAC